MLDRAHHLTWRCPPELPVSELVIGRSIHDAAAILPRVFNLCRGAQETAARLAFGLPLAERSADALRAEILRDHVLMLCIKLPGHFGAAPYSLPAGWMADPALLRPVLLGDAPGLPCDRDGLDRQLAAGQGVMALLGQIRESFAPGEAASDVFVVPHGVDALSRQPFENSVAGRWAMHPLMQSVEQANGRGPFWRVLGRVIELEALISGVHLGYRATPSGEANVAAARGAYAVAANTEAGIVTTFRRVTPTDHLLAAGGVMEQSLARLPAEKVGLAPLLLDVLDPCVPVQLEVCDA